MSYLESITLFLTLVMGLIAIFEMIRKTYLYNKAENLKNKTNTQYVKDNQ